jgi:hypothetical protein
MKKKHAGALALAAAVAAGAAHAAGGHHGVDDATTLPAGSCEQETWFSRGGGQRLLHVGLNCGAGPVELGLAGEHGRDDAGSSANAWNVEVKWARNVTEAIAVGVDVQPVWHTHVRPRENALRLMGLATWVPRTDWALHLNLGRDFVRGATDLPHYGIGADWTAAPDWTFTLERFAEERTHVLRGGVRWTLGRGWTLDVSRAQRLSGPAPSNWTVGLTLALGDEKP